MIKTIVLPIDANQVVLDFVGQQVEALISRAKYPSPARFCLYVRRISLTNQPAAVLATILLGRQSKRCLFLKVRCPDNLVCECVIIVPPPTRLKFASEAFDRLRVANAQGVVVPEDSQPRRTSCKSKP